jgi:CheY-like chemotaxis protein
MTAKIYRFPKAGKKKAAPKKAEQADTPAGLVRQPRVLLIVGDDEVKEVFSEALTKAGCIVTPYKLDARYYPAILLDLFDRNPFDVVIPTNLGIPFVYVPDLVSLTQKFGKGAGIAVVSGWVQDDFVADLAKIPRTAFFEAPANLEQLAAKIRELTDMEPVAGTVGLPRLHVLLGDSKDNKVARFFFDWLVARYGGLHKVRVAVQDSGKEILRIATERTIHLFVVNLTPLWSPGDPFRDHIDFAGYLKRRFGKPVVMLTGFTRSDLKGQAIAAGVDAYFRHPLDLEKIGPVMDRLLNVKKED